MKKWISSCLATAALVCFAFSANAEPVVSPTGQNGTHQPLSSPAVHDNRGPVMNNANTNPNMNRMAPNNVHRNDGRTTINGETGFNYRANQATRTTNNWSWLGLLGLFGLTGLMGRNRNPETER